MPNNPRGSKSLQKEIFSGSLDSRSPAFPVSSGSWQCGRAMKLLRYLAGHTIPGMSESFFTLPNCCGCVSNRHLFWWCSTLPKKGRLPTRSFVPCVPRSQRVEHILSPELHQAISGKDLCNVGYVRCAYIFPNLQRICHKHFALSP